jgi:protein-tyrosine phosphatase
VIDIHCHILPGLDDGPKTMEQSLEMLRAAAASGTTDIIATPHASPAYPFDESRVHDTFDEVCALIDVPIRLHLGCEVYLNYANFRNLLSRPEIYTLNRSRYVLLELPNLFSTKPVTRAVEGLIGAGLAPVIAHAERNGVLQKDSGLALRWKELGCLIQVTGQSFIGSFGKSAMRAAEHLIDRRIADVVASDAHDRVKRSPDLRLAYDHVSLSYGTEFAERLFVGNPALVLSNCELLPVARQAHGSRRLFHSGLSFLRSIKNAG